MTTPSTSRTLRALIGVALATGALALPATPASAAGNFPNPISCGTGEPAYTGWNYFELKSFGPACRNAHKAAETYVYDFSTEGVIDPPRHWDRCRDKELDSGLFKGKCSRTKDGERQKITFRFGGPDQPWYP
jgi:hypothetical protein